MLKWEEQRDIFATELKLMEINEDYLIIRMDTKLYPLLLLRSAAKDEDADGGSCCRSYAAEGSDACQSPIP